MWFALVVWLALGGTAAAQRGETWVRQEATTPVSVSRAPGLLDTNTLAGGQCALTVPILALDCGLGDSVSVGTFLIGDLMNLSGDPTLNARLRFRVHAEPRLTMTLDAIGFFYLGDESSGFGGMLLGNTTLRLSGAHAFNLTLGVAHLQKQQDRTEMLAEERSTALGLVAGLGYTLRLSRRFSLSAAFVTVPVASGSVEQKSFVGTLSPSAPLIDRSVIRALVEWRFARSWALSGGLMVAARNPLPWGSLEVLW